MGLGFIQRALLLATIGAAFSPMLSAEQPDARQSIDALTAATSLDASGQSPWHLRMTFELYDLQGKQKESGTLEEWWVSPAKYRVVVKSPSFSQTIPGKDDAAISREAYLVDRLRKKVTHPIPKFDAAKVLSVLEKTQSFGKVQLSCLNVTESTPHGDGSSSSYKLCTDPGADKLRLFFSAYDDFLVERNRLGRFENVSVALDNSLSYAGKLAITGHVDALEGYDPLKSPVELTTSPEETIGTPGGIVAGRRLRGDNMYYPDGPREAHISGAVVLYSVISKEGTISSLVVISSPDQALTGAALKGVRSWTYSPYLLNGKPVEVCTTITVHYNSSSRGASFY